MTWTDPLPPEARRLLAAVSDGVWQHIPLVDVSDDTFEWFQDHVETPLRKLLCDTYGHSPTADQCGRPEHDFCVTCETLMPGAAPRSQPAG